MGRAKEIVLKVIPSKTANSFIKTHHYSGKVVNNSSLHFGAFLDNKLGGVMSYGSPLDKRKVLPLVVDRKTEKPVLWNEMLELNRMAFSDLLPRNSESRCIAISFRLIKKNAPHIKWILSFSDGAQCGDGTIYRASGFELTKISENNTLIKLPGGEIISNLTLTAHSTTPKVKALAAKYGVTINKSSCESFFNAGAEKIPGYQLRYIKILNPKYKLNCPSIPFSKIDEIGAGMYKGEQITRAERRL